MWFDRLVHSNMYRIDVDQRHDASLEFFNDLTAWKTFLNVFVVEHIIILSLIFVFDYSNIMSITDKYWFFCFAFSSTRFFCFLLSRMNTMCKQTGVLIFILWRIVMRRNRQVTLRRIWHAQGNAQYRYVSCR